MKTKFSSILVIVLTMVSCNNNKKAETNVQVDTTTVENSVPESNSETAQLYACPMHPEVTGQKDDICPKCEMKLSEPAVDGTSPGK